MTTESNVVKASVPSVYSSQYVADVICRNHGHNFAVLATTVICTKCGMRLAEVRNAEEKNT